MESQRGIHARDNRELRKGSEQDHSQHQNGLGNNGAEVSAGEDDDQQKNQSTKQADPMQPHERTAHHQAGSVDACRRGWEERRQLGECDGSKNRAEKNQRAQPKAEHQIDQRVKEGPHAGYTGGRPVSR